MKTQKTNATAPSLKVFGIFLTLLLAFMTFNPIAAQNLKTESPEALKEGRVIKGVVSNSEGPLESASVILKGSSIGTTTNALGEFTFPKLLKTGDILLITYLGFESQEIPIKANTTFINLELSEELIEFIGAVNMDTPYKSKRSKE